MKIDNRPRIMLVVAAICVVAAWFGVMLLLNFMRVERDLIITIAPASSIVMAVVFLYLGRDKHRRPMGDESPPMLELNGNVISMVEPANASMPADVSVPEHEEETAIIVEALAAQSQPQSTVMAEVPQSTIIASEIPSSVHKVMEAIEKRTELQCLLIAAPSHGVLQDRLNNWLSGKYGRVVSTSMATNEKGFYLAVFYESFPMQT